LAQRGGAKGLDSEGASGGTAAKGSGTTSGGTTANSDSDTPELPDPGVTFADEVGGTTGSSSTTGNPARGGSDSGGSSALATGTNPIGGSVAVGGRTFGGSTAVGGRTSGASTAVGGRAFGGSTAVGGRATAAGGRAFGGASSGGASTGGASTGGASTGGTSTGGASTGDDGCSDTLALGLTLSEIAVFQSGKISVMKSGAAVTAVTESGAEIVEGRPTLVRVYVKTDSGFQARQLSARLTIGNTTLYAKQKISASSSELTLDNSFQIAVPASAVSAGLNYSVQVVECESGSGSAHTPRFPATGTETLATRATGGIKLKLIPVTANGITPALDALAGDLKPFLESIYPTNLATVTVDTKAVTGCALTAASAGNGTTWSDCLTLVRNRRISDKPASDVYYMGVVTPASTYSGYCGKGCVAGIGYVAGSNSSAASARAALSVGYLPSALYTIAHELGHNHGLNHSPGCNAASADSKFPYLTNGVAHIGWVGWSQQTPDRFFDPAKYTDLMAYCSPQWVSDYVYAKQASRIAQLNGATMLWDSAVVSTWQILDVVNGKATWGPAIADPEPAFGEAETATVYDVSGTAISDVVVYRSDVGDIDGASMYLVPTPQLNWATLRIGGTHVAFF
jgi:hypothetical protein